MVFGMVLPVILYLKVYSLYSVIKLCATIITIMHTYICLLSCAVLLNYSHYWHLMLFSQLSPLLELIVIIIIIYFAIHHQFLCILICVCIFGV